MANDGWIKLSANTQWNIEAPEEDPTLELRIELTGYTSRTKMANVLRMLAHWLDEGVIHPFEVPTEDATYRGEWDEDEQVFRVYKDSNEEGDRRG